jgi:NADH-quinone oxidoreductase subunit G
MESHSLHLTIDGRSVAVPEGTRVIAAAERLGIRIPRLCYHPALGPAGACRLCAVMFREGPVKGLQMSCMVACQEGMVVATDDPEALAFRRQVIEWLMLHHPHDCPVCDEGGHCLLQEMTLAGGHALRRSDGPKRTFPDQDLGPLLQHEMNRCIHCYRCVRFYQEYCGGRDLGTLRLGNRTWFGRYRPGRLASPFAGNLIEICPTGVFTDRPSRYRGRRWDYERHPCLCLSCALGCRTLASVRYRELVRIEADFSPQVNGHFICDRGRYAYPYASLPERPRQGRAAGRPLPPADALQAAAEALERAARPHGPGAVALAGSPRASLETLAALRLLAAARGYRPPVFFPRRDLAAGAGRAAAVLSPALHIAPWELAQADPILLLDADPLEQAPMLALALRQAARAGARVASFGPRPPALPLAVRHVPTPPARLAAALAAAGRGDAGDPAAPETALQAAMETLLAAGRQPVLVTGAGPQGLALAGPAAACARRLREQGRDARLLPLLPGANAFGAALLDPQGEGFDDLLAAIEGGAVRALVLVECDPFHGASDPSRVASALAALDLLLVMDYLPSRAAAAAHLFIPSATIFEAGGRWVNTEGRVQAAAPLFAGGQPASQVAEGGHPPRRYDLGLPGGGVRPAWRLLDDLATRGKRSRDETLAHLEAFLEGQVPALEDLPPLERFPQEGWLARPAGTPPGDAPQPEAPPAAAQPFGGDELAAWSPLLAALDPGAGNRSAAAAGGAKGEP